MIKKNTEQSINGIYCDTQGQEKAGGAQYFLDFLGCIYTYDPKKQNEDFYEITHQTFLDKVKDPIKQLECFDKLNLFMRRDTNKVIPQDFIDQEITDDTLKKELDNLYKDKNIELNGFDKDIEYIQTKVKLMRVSFENGFSFSVDSETYQNDVIISEVDGCTNIQVKSKIKGKAKGKIKEKDKKESKEKDEIEPTPKRS